MTARWDVAAVVVSLLAIFAQIISVSPAASNIFHRALRKLLCLIWPQGGVCRRVVWNDIPPGLLHRCNPPALCPHHLPQPSNAEHSINCLDETFGQVFTEAWKQLQPALNDTRFITQKPNELPFSQGYIQVDIKTLKAFLMLTAKSCHTCETDGMIGFLETQRFGGIITVHLKSPARVSVPMNYTLSKFEVDWFIEGYPPFYRQSIETTGGVKLGPLIANSDGIGRGSWILAVGMSNSFGALCATHNMQRVFLEKEGVHWRRTLLHTAFEMIQRTLNLIMTYEKGMYKENPHYTSTDTWSYKALTCYEVIMHERYSNQPLPLKLQEIEASSLFEGVIGDCPCKNSCIGNNPHADTCGRDLFRKKEPAKSLNEKECKVAIEIFDSYRLSDNNLEIIMPKLSQVLQTLILGMMKVEHNFSYLGRKLELPQELVNQNYIYLRKCAGNMD